MFEHYQVGKQVPPNFLKNIESSNEERNFLSFNEHGLTACIILNNITKEELKEYQGNLTVIYKDLALPFLVLKFKDSSFEFPIFPNKALSVSNKLTIMFIELNGFILKHNRMLGLEMELVNALVEGVNFTNTLTKEQAQSIVSNQIYPNYTAEDMCKGGIRQVFRR
ncbi:hypothetical protein ACNSOL_11770 (plasmid) [Aliarcobacter lanthieri]|uniref:hypothetical protein n=1 Tax=Aliarcobacter lanthieri TaxID=1355374 RepID=UPI003AAC3817